MRKERDHLCTLLLALNTSASDYCSAIVATVQLISFGRGQELSDWISWCGFPLIVGPLPLLAPESWKIASWYGWKIREKNNQNLPRNKWRDESHNSRKYVKTPSIKTRPKPNPGLSTLKNLKYRIHHVFFKAKDRKMIHPSQKKQIQGGKKNTGFPASTC